MARPSKCALLFLAISLSLLLSVSSASPTVYFTPANINMAITVNTTLYSNLTAGNLTIAPGLTIITNGHEIYVANSLTAQNDIFITGNAFSGGSGCNACGGHAGGNANLSFGGSGGAGGGWAMAFGGGPGGSSQLPGGRSDIGTGNPGSVPSDPTVNSPIIVAWYYGGMQNYLEGAGGGGGGEASTPSGYGGGGGFGLYVQAGKLALANSIIYANGAGGAIGYLNGGGGGGGGGCGRIAIAYQDSYSPATYNAAGGSAGHGSGTDGYGGGKGGGPCNLLVYQYASEPIIVLGPVTPINSTGGGNPPYEGPCYSVNAITAGQHISVYLTGSWFDIAANSVSGEGVLVTINRINYSLRLNQTQQIPGSDGYAYTIELKNRDAAAGSADLMICSSYGGATTTTTSTSSTSSSSSTEASTSASTTVQPPPYQSAAGKTEEIGAISAIILILLLIALFSDREKRPDQKPRK